MKLIKKPVIIPIGTSKGLILPAWWLRSAGLNKGDQVELREIREGDKKQLVITPVEKRNTDDDDKC